MEKEEVIPNEIIDYINGVPIWRSHYTEERWAWFEDWAPNFDDIEDKDFLAWAEQHGIKANYRYDDII